MYKPIILLKLCTTLVVVLLLNGCAFDSCYKPSTKKSYNYSNSYTTGGSLENPKKVVVQRGETFQSIANLYGIDPKEFATINGISKPYRVHIGQTLYLPGSGFVKSLKAYGSKSSIPVSLKKKKKNKVSKKVSKGNYHVVQRGETLYGIANSCGQNYRQLANLNNLSSPYHLKVGQHLRLGSSQEKQTSSSSSTHIVQQGETLHSIAQYYGYTTGKLAHWNNLTSSYYLRAGQSLRLSEPPRLNTSRMQRDSQQSGYHTVALGDTLYSLARRYGNSITDIAEWNNLQPPYTLSQGQSLQVAPLNKGIPSTPNTPKNLKQVANRKSGYHTVTSGDTLYRISRKYGYTVSQIVAWNNLHLPYNLSVGQRLWVYPSLGNASPNRSQNQKASTSHFHTIKPGETLYSVSRHYGQNVANIARWNNLQPPYNLSIGQRLKVSYRQTSSQKRSSGSFHKVQRGETLRSIAAIYGINADELADWNGIGNPYTIYPGQKMWLAPH
ncbi:LysM peptidoglycan-binding domain-containing protein [Candidatus Parabeggiatoa sp. HSG14]|uniref:LysM domain-containing protein n=1 Tax=Candidatus Parabeggiatoa sp. HSG14 TaxID=3055593 RepID=UPI0025A78E8D|nr:LysM peptidoglycan-binding domain-containing protein [Thiotrichales bacterium HSG14]